MSINEVRYLPECGSTNAYMKEHFEEFGPVGAVYTTNQTAGRGRLGRTWVNAEGKALYYTVAIREPLAQPATLPLLASLAVRRQLALRYGVDCQIKWPNDLLLNGKKIVGILCESVCYGYQQQGRGILCGIGINLAQPQSYFDAADLPHGTSLALQGAAIDLEQDPGWLAEALTDFGFDRPLYTFARDGFAPFREEYKAACVNIGRRAGSRRGRGCRRGGPSCCPHRQRRGARVHRRGLRARHLRFPLKLDITQRPRQRIAPPGALFQTNKSPLRRLRYTGGDFCFGVLLWCEEESCARETVAAPLPCAHSIPDFGAKVITFL